MEKVKWGILGSSTIARNLMIPAMNRSVNGEFYAIASRSAAKLEAFRGQCERLYAGYDQLLCDPLVQAVYVPLPNNLHCEWAVKAAEHGKHILCEKPLAMSYAECVLMADAARANGVYLMEGFMNRHSAKTRKVCEIIKSGVLGPIRYIHSLNGFDISDPKNVRLRKETGGGALFDMGCYCVNFIDMIMELDGAELVDSGAHFVMRTDMDGEEVDVRCNANLFYSNGAVCSFATWFDSQPTVTTTIVGRRGTLTIPYTFTDDLIPMQLSFYDFAEDPACKNKEIMVINPAYVRTREIDVPESDRYRYEIEEMSRAVLDGTPPSFGVEASLRNMKTIEALYASEKKWSESWKR